MRYKDKNYWNQKKYYDFLCVFKCLVNHQYYRTRINFQANQNVDIDLRPQFFWKFDFMLHVQFGMGIRISVDFNKNTFTWNEPDL